LSPISYTKKFAHDYVTDLISMIDDANSQNGSVLFGQPITRNFQKVPPAASPAPAPTWSSVMPHPEPDQESLEMLQLWLSTSAASDMSRYKLSYGTADFVVHLFVQLF